MVKGYFFCQNYIWLHLDFVSPDVADHLSPTGCQENRTCVEIRSLSESLQDLKDWAETEVTSQSKIILTQQSTYLGPML
jgi:hypothetical protein